MTNILLKEDNIIFALDIGTRTVIGIVALVEGGKLRVVAQHLMEHESRAMFDGQIHDISRVAGTVRELKGVLEDRLGFRLNRAAIAAAGRSLFTKQCTSEMEVDQDAEIDAELISKLEIEAVRRAHVELENSLPDEASEKYYCVGYSVVNYYLNNYRIASLLGHRGRSVAADVLATFLPESVVNGLYAVLNKVGLEPVSLTLEPIAAIDVAIPENMRLLNLALVDIGAGTSDIAITRKGTVVSYGMVPVAGDEVTEAISEGLLVSFDVAEDIKRLLAGGDKITYRDILGQEYSVEAGEISVLVEPVLERWAEELSQAIVNLNGGQSPASVFLVGGGSRLPGINNKLAEKLGLDPRKVAVRGRDTVVNLVVDPKGLEGPEGITVLGIATVALKKLGQNFITLKIDGKEFMLFNSKDLNVANALALVNFNPRHLIGHNGRDISFTLNGRPEVVYGGLARAAEVFIHGNGASLRSPLKDRDEVTVNIARDGADARAVVGDYLAGHRVMEVFVNGRRRVLKPLCLLNDEPAGPEGEISRGDNLVIRSDWTLGQLEGIDFQACSVTVNGMPAGPDHLLSNGDDIRLEIAGEDRVEQPAPLGSGAEQGTYCTITLNGEEIRLGGDKPPIFVDVFNHLDIDPTRLRGGNVVLRINGAAAGFTDLLKGGDVVEVILDEN